MNELALVEAIRGYTARPGRDKSLIASIGDDCAILRPRPGEDLLLTTDFVIEDVHFRRRAHATAAVAIGWKAMARSLSDIAAMGGTPRYALVSLALAPWTTAAYVRGLYRGMTRLAEAHSVRIIGGDISASPKLTLDVIAIGSVPKGKALRRDTARPGDILYVTGPLGRASAAGYHDQPNPRVALGRKLLGKATACMDLSDSLTLDLHRLAKASGVAASLDPLLPAAPGATLENVLFGGEDYELLCALPPAARPPRFLTRVGHLQKGAPGALTFAGASLPPRGWLR
jgi:thiamine-monophosphate kinase